MGFHLLAEIAESKTCSCDSLTPAPFYNQFYSQYHRTQRTSKWRIGAANKALDCILPVTATSRDAARHGMPFTADAPRNKIAPSFHLVCTYSDILTTLYFICVCRKLHCKSSAVYNFNLIFYHLSHVDPTRPDPATLVNFLTRSDPTRGSGQQSYNSERDNDGGRRATASWLENTAGCVDKQQTAIGGDVAEQR